VNWRYRMAEDNGARRISGPSGKRRRYKHEVRAAVRAQSQNSWVVLQEVRELLLSSEEGSYGMEFLYRWWRTIGGFRGCRLYACSRNVAYPAHVLFLLEC